MVKKNFRSRLSIRRQCELIGLSRLSWYYKPVQGEQGEPSADVPDRRTVLEGVAPGSRTRRRQPEHEVYPYLLRDVVPARPNQVWSSDIMFIPKRVGFMYLVVLLDWYSRYVVAWALSITLDTGFRVEALKQTFERGRPEISTATRVASSPARCLPAG